ncbi:MAG: hypothetical protein WCF60_08645, partial [Anaerobacillus sp.]
MWTEMITPQAPYDVERLFGRVNMDPLQYKDIDRKLLKVPLVLESGDAVLSVQSIGTPSKPTFEIKGEAMLQKEEAMTRIRDIFDFDMEPENILAALKGTEIGPLVDCYVGMPIICEPNAYSALLKNIVHQQLNMTFAYTLTHRFVTRYGRE